MPKLQRTGVQPLGQAGMATNVVRVKVVEFAVHGTQNLVFRLVLLEFILRTENGPPKISVHFPIFFHGCQYSTSRIIEQGQGSMLE